MHSQSHPHSHSASETVSSSSSLPADRPYGMAQVDYSAAAEYVDAHYGIHDYFGPSRNAKASEPIYDARAGFIEDVDDKGVVSQQRIEYPASLETNGFGISNVSTDATVDYTDLNDVGNKYLKELRDVVIPQALNGGAPEGGGRRLRSVVFWHPMIRGEEETIGSQRAARQNEPSTASVATNVHIDIDAGAFGLDGILNLVHKNQVPIDDGVGVSYSSDSHERTNLDGQGDGGCNLGTLHPDFCPKRAQQQIRDENLRFVLLNIWRPLVPVHDARSPLGILATRYPQQRRWDRNSIGNSIDGMREWVGEEEEEGTGNSCCFPRRPCMQRSRWYTFPSMQSNECLIFKQFDRRTDMPSDLRHSALIGLERIPYAIPQESANQPSPNPGRSHSTLPLQPPDGIPRRSFDIKALVLIEEAVDVENDRLHEAFTPRLTLEESGEFCDCQSKKNRDSNSVRIDNDM